MNKIYYVSPKGCAETIAEAISREIRCTKEPLMPAYPPENVGLMFIGCEGSKADKVTLDFLNSVTPNRVRNAALFSCSPKQDTGAIEQMKAVLVEKGINVLDSVKTFPGKGFLSGKNPGNADIEAAKQWADECLTKIK